MHGAPERREALREGARAIDQPIADMDDDVRVRADHVEPAFAHRRVGGLVMVGRLGRVVEEARADDMRGAVEVREHRRPTGLGRDLVDQRVVALGADVVEWLRATLGDQRHGAVAGRDEVVEGLARHAEFRELRPDRSVRPRRIGDQHDGTAPLTKTCQRPARLREGALSVVDDAPDVGKHDVVSVRDLGEAGDQARRGGGGAHGRGLR